MEQSSPWLLQIKCNLKPKNQPLVVLPSLAPGEKTLWLWMRFLWHTVIGVESIKPKPSKSARLNCKKAHKGIMKLNP